MITIKNQCIYSKPKLENVKSIINLKLFLRNILYENIEQLFICEKPSPPHLPGAMLEMAKEISLLILANGDGDDEIEDVLYLNKYDTIIHGINMCNVDMDLMYKFLILLYELIILFLLRYG